MGITHGEWDGPDPELVLKRHENESNYEPPHYPNWDEKQWAKIWQSHERWLRRRGEIKEMERIQAQKVLKEKQQAVANLLSTISHKVIPITQKRAEEKRKEWSLQQQGINTRKSGNAKKAMTLTQNNRESFILLAKGGKEGESFIIYLLYMARLGLRGATKKAKKNSESLVSLFEGVLKEVGIPTDEASIYNAVKEMPESVRKAFSKQHSFK